MSKSRYPGDFIIETHHWSDFNKSWSLWVECAKRKTYRKAKSYMDEMCEEKTALKQEFRIIHPMGMIIEECSNAENIQ